MTSDKIIQIFKLLCVARVLLCLAEKISSEYFAKHICCVQFSLRRIRQTDCYLLEQPCFELYLSVCACVPLFESLRDLTLIEKKKFQLFFCDNT